VRRAIDIVRLSRCAACGGFELFAVNSINGCSLWSAAIAAVNHFDHSVGSAREEAATA
jgi:hypothetical protein